MKIFIFVVGMVLLFLPFPSLASTEGGSSSPGKGPVKVAILPMAIHSSENLGFLREGLVDMLSSRVELSGRVTVVEKGAVKKAMAQQEGDLDLEKARKIGEALGADFIVFGSLTKLGDTTSLDLKVMEVKGAKPSAPVFVMARKMEEVIAQVEDISWQIDEKVLGYPVRPQKAEKASVASAPARPPVPAPGPKEAAAIPAPPLPAQPASFPKPAAGGEFWRSQPFPFKIKGMAAGDLDGDGRNELVVIEEKNLWIYRWENEEFKRVKKIEGGKFDSYLAVDVADVEKEGKAKIFVTNFQKDRLSSFVVAYRDGDFKVISSGLGWFLRAIDWAGKGPVLLGQRIGEKDTFDWPVYELGWDGKKYKDIRKAEIPRIFSIYGFTPFAHDGKTDFLFLDASFRLRMVDAKGKTVWRSQADYGSDNMFRVKDMTFSAIEPGLSDVAFVNVRLFSREKDVILVRNISSIGQFVGRTKIYRGGELQILNWNGAMFMENWKSQEIPGYLADFQITDLNGSREKELILAVNIPKESIFSGEQHSALLIRRMQ